MYLKPIRIDILGVPVDCVDMAGALGAVQQMIAGDRPQSVIAVNPEKVIKAQSDDGLRDQLKQAGLLIPDGIGVVLAAAILGLGAMRRVPGSELMPEICALAAAKGYGIFLFGASPEVNALASAELIKRYPKINIVGRQHGYVKDNEMSGVIERINSSGAQILFIALGSPKQEQWMATHINSLNSVRVLQGVGGTFDVIAGRVQRAPAVFLRLNLEWLYRLLAQPKRILRQTALPRFVYRVLVERIFGKLVR
jgi:N-acetylglucosaminyldiphosphoundecaprenol N-acetyl-beta-D-mannosaminyltransferase